MLCNGQLEWCTPRKRDVQRHVETKHEANQTPGEDDEWSGEVNPKDFAFTLATDNK